MMRLYNTLTRTEEPFEPSLDNTVRMYTCGLTVYARGHIGNFRTFVCVDVLRRTLKYLHGYRHAPRDELHRRGRPDDRRRAEGRHGAARVHRSVHCRVSRGCPRAGPRGGRRDAARDRRGEPAARWRDLVTALDRNGHTYRSDGSVYFKISTLPDYGSLARLDHEGMQAGRARRFRQLRQGRRPRFRAVEGDQGRASRPGTSSIRRDGRAGTSSARRWRCGCSASRRSTSIPAASI